MSIDSKAAYDVARFELEGLDGRHASVRLTSAYGSWLVRGQLGTFPGNAALDFQGFELAAMPRSHWATEPDGSPTCVYGTDGWVRAIASWNQTFRTTATRRKMPTTSSSNRIAFADRAADRARHQQLLLMAGPRGYTKISGWGTWCRTKKTFCDSIER